MAKTAVLKLNLTEDDSTTFGQWRASIDGNNASGNESNMQIIEKAIVDLQGQIKDVQDSIGVALSGDY